MDVTKTLEKINKNRETTEAPFVFCLWKDPQLYDDYKTVNVGTDKTLQNDDAKFYFALGRAMWEQGFKTFDNVTVFNFLQGKPALSKRFEQYGGWTECEELMNLVNTENVDVYFDKIAKMNALSILCKKTDEMFSDVERFDKATSQQVYEAFELLNNSVSLTTGHDSQVEDLVIDEEYIQECNAGTGVGLSYAKGAPILNWLTLGLPIGDIYMLAGHSGTGKSSFVFENMVLPLAEAGTSVAIVSNEMTINAYKNLLLAHVLSKDLSYWKITRKKLKTGNFSEEELAMMRAAAKITKERYANIKFVKLFENDTTKVLKYIKKLARTGVKAFVYDTMKSDDEMDEKMWQQLLLNSRRIFNEVSREQVAMVTTFQLALSTTNQRFLDAGCLSNSKQVKEVVSELVMMRKLWRDEYSGERYDCKPHKRMGPDKRDEPILLDEKKTYVVAFLNKTRNDEDGQTVLYEFNGAWNTWREVGFCTIVNDHKSFN